MRVSFPSSRLTGKAGRSRFEGILAYLLDGVNLPNFAGYFSYTLRAKT